MLRPRRAAGRRSPPRCCHGWWAFFRTYVLRLGFLDGREGFMLAVSNAEGSYYRYSSSCCFRRKSVMSDG